MKNKNKAFATGLLALSFLGAALLVGCDGRRDEPARNLTFDEMKPSDALVVVNGKRLTKQELADKLLRIYRNVLRKPGSNRNAAGQTVLRERGRLIDQFIARRVMADAATRQNLVPKDAVAKSVASNLAAVAAAKKLTVQEYEWRERDMARYLRDKFEEDVLIEAFIATNVTPHLGITPSLVSNYLETVDSENAVVAQTNALRRAQLVAIRDECLKDPGRWASVAEEVSVESSDESEVDYGEFQSSETAEAVFTTPVGGIAGPLEEEDGFRLVKVVAATTPGSTNSFGEVAARGTRTCSQIYVEKDPLFMKWSFEETTEELKRQRLTARVNEFVAEARTNGTNVIEFPHGTDFWGRPKPPAAKAEAKAEEGKETEKGN